MKTAIVLAAAAALSLSAVPAAHASSSSHGHDAAAHARRFSRVLRVPAPDAQPVIDLEALPAANETSLAVNGTEGHRLMKRGYSGRATFFAPGLGACGTYSSASDYVSRERTGRTAGSAGAASQVLVDCVACVLIPPFSYCRLSR